MGVPVERSFRLPAEAAPAEPFTYNVLVLLVEFRDVRADRKAHPPVFYHRRFFDGAVDNPSLDDYYAANAGGRFHVAGFVTDWVTLDSTYAFYAREGTGNGGGGIDPFAYPHNAQKLVEDAVARVRDLYNWERFDNNKDGLVDGLFVIHAGPGNDEFDFDPSRFLAHQFRTTFEIPTPGASVFDYALADESARLGVIAHEFGHLLGLIDLYSVSGIGYGLGDWSLMATGALLDGGRTPANLDAWSRTRLGFTIPTRIDATPGQVVTFTPRSDIVLRLWGAAGETEYFLVEDRHHEGFDAWIPGEGLLVYHVDEKVQTNSSSSHPRVRIEQADGQRDLNRVDGNRGDPGDPFPYGASPLSPDQFDATTSPGSGSYLGTPSNVALYNIQRVSGGFSAEVVIARPPAPELVRFAVHEEEGDGDGYVEPGETASVDATVTNRGAAVTAGDLVLVFTPGEDAALLDLEPITSLWTIGQLAPGETIFRAGAFAFRFRADAPDSVGTFVFNTIFSCSQCVPTVQDGTTQVSLGVTGGQAFDFESGAPGWTHLPLNPILPDPWELTAERSHSPGHSFAFAFEGRPYDGGLDAALVSPSFDVPAGGRLSFWHSIDAETLGTGRAWDGGRVEISFSGGAWRPIEPVGGYPFRLESGSGNTLFESRVFSGHSTAFQRAVFDLAEFAGAAARVRFRFATDLFSDAGQVQRGWFIDDVVVTGGEPALTAVAQLEPGGVRIRWNLDSLPAGVSGFEVFRRPDVAGARAASLGEVAAVTGTLEYSLLDAPAPGRYVYEVRMIEASGPGLGAATTALQVPDAGTAIRLVRPYPAPYRVAGPPANFEFFVPEASAGSPLTLDVFDVTGRLAVRLLDGPARAGANWVQWAGDTPTGRIRAGIYFVRIAVGGVAGPPERLVVLS